MNAEPGSKNIDVTEWHFNKTLFVESNRNIIPGTKIIFSPHTKMQFNKNKSQKLALLTLEWRYQRADLIHFAARDIYKIDYSDFTENYELITGIIMNSYKRCVNEFKRKISGSGFDFSISYPSETAIRHLYKKIFQEFQHEG